MKTVAFSAVFALWLMLWLGFIYFSGFKNCFWFCSVIFSKLTKLNITTPDEKYNNNGCPDEEISSEMLTILQSHLTISLTLSLSLFCDPLPEDGILPFPRDYPFNNTSYLWDPLYCLETGNPIGEPFPLNSLAKLAIRQSLDTVPLKSPPSPLTVLNEKRLSCISKLRKFRNYPSLM